MLNIRFGTDYLLHRLKAKNRHGLHSPFVYRLVDEVIYDFSDKKVYQEMEAIQKRLPNDSTPGISPKLLKLLCRIVADRQPEAIAAPADDLNAMQSYLKLAAPDAKFYNLSANQQVDNTILQIDLAYFNGKHPKQTTLNYFEECLPKVHEGSLMIFNDIYRNTEMRETWAAVKAHPQVSITVDLFWIGLVYFRTGKVKEDFFIKF